MSGRCARNLWVWGGIAGIIGTLCYILDIVIPWPETRTGTSLALLVVSAWPILSIIYGIGTALVFSGVAIRGRSGLGLAWPCRRSCWAQG